MRPRAVEKSRRNFSRKVDGVAADSCPEEQAQAAIHAISNDTLDFRRRFSSRSRSLMRSYRRDSGTDQRADAWNSRLEPGLPEWTISELFVMGPRYHRSTSSLLENRISQAEQHKTYIPTAKNVASAFGALLKKDSGESVLSEFLGRVEPVEGRKGNVGDLSSQDSNDFGTQVQEPLHVPATSDDSKKCRKQSGARVLKIRGHAFFRYDGVVQRMKNNHKGRRLTNDKHMFPSTRKLESGTSSQSTESSPLSTTGSRTGRKIYLHAVHASSTVNRCPRILRSFKSSQLSLRGRIIGEFSSEWLTRNNYITDLDLSDNPLGDCGVEKLLNCLSLNSVIRKLTLSNVTKKGALTPQKSGVALQSCLSIDTQCNLQNLNLNANGITDSFCLVAFAGVAPDCNFSESLECPRRRMQMSLRVLSLQENDLRQIGAGTIGEPNASCTLRVEQLFLGWNAGGGNESFSLGYRDATMKFSKFMQLRTLDLSYCALTDEEGAVLAETIANLPDYGRIHTLDLSGNRFQKTAAIGFGRVLLENRSLHTLKLSQNVSLGVRGICGILTALSFNESIQQLWIDGCASTDSLHHSTSPTEVMSFLHIVKAESLRHQRHFRFQKVGTFLETSNVLLTFLQSRNPNRSRRSSKMMSVDIYSTSPWRDILQNARKDIRQSQDDAAVTEELKISLFDSDDEIDGGGNLSIGGNQTSFDPNLSQHFCLRRRFVESKMLYDMPLLGDAFAKDWTEMMKRSTFVRHLASFKGNAEKIILEEGIWLQSSYILQDIRFIVRKNYNCFINVFRQFSTRLGDAFGVTKSGWGDLISELHLGLNSSTITSGHCLLVFTETCKNTIEIVPISEGNVRTHDTEENISEQLSEAVDEDAKENSGSVAGAANSANEHGQKDNMCANRCKFLEACIRLALLKYRNAKNPATAVELLLTRNVVPLYVRLASPRVDGHVMPSGSMDFWRSQVYYTGEVHDAIRDDAKGEKVIQRLGDLFHIYSMQRSDHLEEGMTITSFLRFFAKAGAMSIVMTEEILCKCFKMALPLNSSQNQNPFMMSMNAAPRLCLPSFIEAAWRVACCSIILNRSEKINTLEVIEVLSQWQTQLKKKRN